MPSKIREGNKVSGCVGPFLPPEIDADGRKAKRRKRERLFGVVLQSSGVHEWDVFWYTTNTVSRHHAKSLKDEGRSNMSQEEFFQLKARSLPVSQPAPAPAPNVSDEASRIDVALANNTARAATTVQEETVVDEQAQAEASSQVNANAAVPTQAQAEASNRNIPGAYFEVENEQVGMPVEADPPQPSKIAVTAVESQQTETGGSMLEPEALTGTASVEHQLVTAE